MVIEVLKEPDFEHRVSLVPENVAALTKKGISVLVQESAGERAFFTDQEYKKAGAQILEAGLHDIGSEIVLSIHMPRETVGKPVLVGVFQPLVQIDSVNAWANRGITTFSLDMLPRTTRAQSMDVLSSQANIAGYKAVLLAAHLYSRYFPMFMTAAGSVPPARVLVLGAGVAGLQAIATARRLGAVVEVFDTRPAVKEEVMSLGARFVEVEGAADASAAGGYAVEQSREFMQKQKARIAESVSKSDIIITTAQIPGKKAPLLVTTEMIRSMRKGSVIVDLASSSGGNTELTVDNQLVNADGVTITGNSALASTMPADASKLYGKNVLNFLQLIIDAEGRLNLNWEDELVKGSCITHDGKVVHDRISALISG